MEIVKKMYEKYYNINAARHLEVLDQSKVYLYNVPIAATFTKNTIELNELILKGNQLSLNLL